MKELLSVVLFKGEQRLRAVVEDESNKVRRTIDYSWKEKDPGDVPPARWAEAIHGELEFQRGEAQRGTPNDLVRG